MGDDVCVCRTLLIVPSFITGLSLCGFTIVSTSNLISLTLVKDKGMYIKSIKGL